jgi:hypothetical protein
MFGKPTYDKDIQSIKSYLRTIASSEKCKTTQGGSVSGNISSTSLSTGTLAEADNIRIATVIARVDTEFDITYTLHDGSSFTHRIYGGVWIIELESYQSPIQSVVVEEKEGTASDVSINYLSK